MNKIEALIQELCPEGVEWKRLGEIAKRNSGTSITAAQMKLLHKENAPIRIFAGGSTIADVEYGDIPDKDIITETSVIVKSRGYIGFEFYEKPFSHKNEFWSYVFQTAINPKYIYYYLLTKTKDLQELAKATSVKIPQLSTKDTDKLPLPIPPLPIQQEIVSILDKFTTLEAELEARTRQYDYYRNQLFNFDEKEVEWKPLGEIGKFIRGKRFVKNDIVSEGVPCIHYGEMYTYYNIWAKEVKSFLESSLATKLRVAHPGDVIIVTAGETIEDIGNAVAWLGDSDVVIHDACFAFSHNLNPKYVSYFLRTELFRSQIKKHISSGKISAIHASGLSKAKMPIPSMSEQERIVFVLDKFDALVNDISVGLPAEISARRKQYEYYRGKLLDFKNVKN
jgi:type I restriction enzyme S subunit